MNPNRWILLGCFLVVPLFIRGDVFVLKDGSTKKGRVVSETATTITVETGPGMQEEIERSDIQDSKKTQDAGFARPTASSGSAAGSSVPSDLKPPAGPDLDLLNAIEKKDGAQAEAALNQGANPNAWKNQMSSVLHLAVMGGSVDVVKLLLAKGADVNIRNTAKRTPLMFAASTANSGLTLGSRAAAQVKGPELVVVVGKPAPESASIRMLKVLIEAGADVNAQSGHQHTALSEAAQQKDPEVVKYLIEKGAEVDCKDINSWTPLMRAVDAGNLENVKVLVEKGANVNHVAEGATPLTRAAYMGCDQIAQYLIDKGADVNFKGTYGTPLGTAKKLGTSQDRSRVIEVLKKAGGTE